MAMNFPDSPSVNDTFTVGTITWKYDGTSWNILTIDPITNLSDSTPLANGTASAGTGGLASRYDHVHPSSGGTGTVTSVDMTVPTGLSVSGNPITTSGTFAVTLSSGYAIPTTASQTNWDTAYTDRLKWDGGSTGLVAATGRTSLGATTVGANLFTATNPSAITFPRINADNTIAFLSAPSLNAALMGYTSTATAGGSTTLTNSSTQYQIFTGTSAQTIVLPVTSTLTTGWIFHIVNNSTGTLTINSSGGNLVSTVVPGTTVMATCIGTTLTTAADWEAGYTDFSTITGTGSAVLSNSPTFTGSVLGIEDIIPYSKTGTLTVSAGTIRYRFPWAATILGVTAAVNTAPTGSSLICDVNKNGTTIFTTQANRPTIAASGTATTTEPTPDVTAMATGDYLTVDIDQIGSSVAGADLTVIVRYKRA